MSRHWEVANAVARFFAAVDGCAWEELAALMAPTIHLDYSSFGRPAAEGSAGRFLEHQHRVAKQTGWLSCRQAIQSSGVSRSRRAR